MKTALIAGTLILSVGALGTYVALRRPLPAEPGVRSGTGGAPSGNITPQRQAERPAETEQGFRTGIFEPPREAPGFVLDGSNGKKVSVSDHLGKVVIMEFGYTFCEYVCPVTLARLTEVHKKLGSAARDVQLIYVTVDPKRDTPERLREYLAAFNPTFIGATGKPEDLEAVLKAYGVVAEQVVSKNKELPYAVDHSSFLYLVDQQGKIRGLVPFGTSADNIAHDVELLLKMRT